MKKIDKCRTLNSSSKTFPNNMNKFLLALFFSLTTTLTYSQLEFREGYIITKTNDTISGLIGYGEGKRNYEYCSFKKPLDQTSVIYKPGELNGYRFTDDKYFLSKFIHQVDEEPKHAFLEVMVKGVATLYKYENHFFVEKSDTTLYQLTNKIKPVVVNGQTFRKESKDYIKTLNILFSDCQTLRKKIQSLDLDEKQLTTLVESYNRCMGSSSISYKGKKKWIELNWRIAAGVNSTMLQFRGGISSNSSILGYAPYNASNYPTLGLSVEFRSPRRKERISYPLEIYYSASEFASYYSSAGFWESAVADFKQVKIPLGIKYTFSSKGISPYFSTGLIYSRILESHTALTRYVQQSNTTIEYKDNNPIGPNQFGVHINIGATIPISKKIRGFFELRREYTTTKEYSPSASPAYSQGSAGSSISSWVFLGGVRF